MIKLSTIKAVCAEQKKFLSDTPSVRREALSTLPMDNHSHALVITGIRRCGKSTLMRQRIGTDIDNAFYINFDTPRLYGFDMSDFQILDKVISESKCHSLYFDEIQSVDGWELYVREKLDQHYNVSVTGSNASLLSRELGTRLTGRHISKELYPFSYPEFLDCRSLEAGEVSMKEYLVCGGFPEYVKYGNEDILVALFDDILYRDIAVRYNIRDIHSLKGLLLYLAANSGNLTSANRLSKMLEMKTAKTVLEYMSFFEEAYLIGSMPRFSYSRRIQTMSPKKIYFIDNALARSVSSGFTKDLGHMLENAVYWWLRRTYKDLFYLNENNHECDFVAFEKGNVSQLVQVCAELTEDNMQRETDGLTTAMRYFNADTGYIVTLTQSDIISTEAGLVHVVPCHEYMRK